jgi:CRISPR/Cas system-associated exonuclease Cas4 (RecB family)
LERELINQDPPIHGFADLIIELDGEDIVGEIKTTKEVSFGFRKQTMTAPGYNLIQILLYMHYFNIPKGFLMYENKNDHSLLIIPVEMTERNKKLLEETIQWMRDVRSAFENDDLPTRPFEQDSKQCSECPVRKACWDAPDGNVTLPVLNIPK